MKRARHNAAVHRVYRQCAARQDVALDAASVVHRDGQRGGRARALDGLALDAGQCSAIGDRHRYRVIPAIEKAPDTGPVADRERGLRVVKRARHDAAVHDLDRQIAGVPDADIALDPALHRDGEVALRRGVARAGLRGRRNSGQYRQARGRLDDAVRADRHGPAARHQYGGVVFASERPYVVFAFALVDRLDRPFHDHAVGHAGGGGPGSQHRDGADEGFEAVHDRRRPAVFIALHYLDGPPPVNIAAAAIDVAVAVGAQLLLGNRAVVVVFLRQRLRAHGCARGDPDHDRGVYAPHTRVYGRAAAGFDMPAGYVHQVPLDLRRRGIVGQAVGAMVGPRLDADGLHGLQCARRGNVDAAGSVVPGEYADALRNADGRAVPDGGLDGSVGAYGDVAGQQPVAAGVGGGVRALGGAHVGVNASAALARDVDPRAFGEVYRDIAVLGLQLRIDAVAAIGAVDMPDDARGGQLDENVVVAPRGVRRGIGHVNTDDIAGAHVSRVYPPVPDVEVYDAAVPDREVAPLPLHGDGALTE